MKKTVSLLILLFFAASVMLASCINNPWKNRVIEDALIERISPKIIHIQTKDESGNLQHYNINICDDISWNGTAIALTDLQVGDHIRVTYDGALIALYPALVEGTTKIELLEDTISQPTKEFGARIDAADHKILTVCGVTADLLNEIFTLTIDDGIHLVKDHHIIDFSTFHVGNHIRVTYRGDPMNNPEIIRIEIVPLDRIDTTNP